MAVGSPETAVRYGREPLLGVLGTEARFPGPATGTFNPSAVLQPLELFLMRNIWGKGKQVLAYVHKTFFTLKV